MQLEFKAPPIFTFLQLFLHNLIMTLAISPLFDAKYLNCFHELSQNISGEKKFKNIHEM